MVSLERAAACIGRPVKHAVTPEVQGVVCKVDKRDVWVENRDGERVPCIPENLVWETTLNPKLAAAILEGKEIDLVQVGYLPPLDLADFGFLFSGHVANDDGKRHPLYIIAPAIQRAYRTWPTAHPWLGHEIEELLGWATV